MNEAKDWDRGSGLLGAAFRFRWVVLGAACLAFLGTYTVALAGDPIYSASAAITLTDPQGPDVLLQDQRPRALDVDRYLQTQNQLVNSPEVQEGASQILGGRVSAAELAETVTASVVEDVNVIEVTAHDRDPATAAAKANAVADAYGAAASRKTRENAASTVGELTKLTERVREQLQALARQPAPPEADAAVEAERGALQEQLVELRRQVNFLQTEAAILGSGVERVDRATPPSTPSSPGPLRAASFAAVSALLAATLLVFWRSERRLAVERDTDASDALGAPLLGTLTGEEDGDGMLASSGATREKHQLIWTALSLLLAPRMPVVLVVASVQRGHDASSVTAGLGAAAADEGQLVTLVDADLTDCALTRDLGATDQPGLSDLLQDRSAKRLPIDAFMTAVTVGKAEPDVVARLRLLPAGTTLQAPPRLYSGQSLENGIRRLQQSASDSLVVVNAPPLSCSADALRLTATADAVVVVVSRGTRWETLREVRRRLDLVGVVPIGYIFDSRPRDRSSSRGRKVRPERARANCDSDASAEIHVSGAAG